MITNTRFRWGQFSVKVSAATGKIAHAVGSAALLVTTSCNVGIKTNCNHCTKLKVSTQKGSWLANAWRLGDSIDQDPVAFIATSKATREAVK